MMAMVQIRKRERMGFKMQEYREILGVHPSAEDVVIREAFKPMAQRYHPDKWTGSSRRVGNQSVDGITERTVRTGRPND